MFVLYMKLLPRVMGAEGVLGEWEEGSPTSQAVKYFLLGQSIHYCPESAHDISRHFIKKQMSSGVTVTLERGSELLPLIVGRLSREG